MKRWKIGRYSAVWLLYFPPVSTNGRVKLMKAKDRTEPAGSLWDVPGLAHDWGCAHSYVWAEIARGRLKAVKMGRRTKIHHDEKLRYEAALPAVEIKQAA